MTQETAIVLTIFMVIIVIAMMVGAAYISKLLGEKDRITAKLNKLEKGVSNELGRQFDYVKLLEQELGRKLKKLKKNKKKLYCFQLIAPDDNGDLIITLDSADTGMMYNDPAVAMITGQFVLQCMTPMGSSDVEVEVYRYKDRVQVVDFNDLKK
jgi:hypothetical protein